MKFIRQMAYHKAKKNSINLKTNHQKRNEMYFGYQVLYGGIFKGIVFILSAFLLGILKPALTIIAFFALIRISAGGQHMESFTRCLIISCVLFLGLGFILKYINLSIEEIITLSIIVFSILFYIIIRYAPRDTPYKPITNQSQIKVLRIISIGISGILMIIQIIFITNESTYIAFAVCLGLLMGAFFVSNIGYKFFNFIDKVKL